MKKSNLVFYILTFFIFSFVLTVDVYAYCPLGPDVTKDLYGVLRIMKILAPLLCIALSVFDAVKAVTKGDGASELKPVAMKFLKRMGYAIILFFLPILVDQGFKMADVWDANGTCDLFNPESNGSTTKVAIPTGRCDTISYDKCSLRNDCEIKPPLGSGAPTCGFKSDVPTGDCSSIPYDKCSKRNDCKVSQSGGGAPTCVSK